MLRLPNGVRQPGIHTTSERSAHLSSVGLAEAMGRDPAAQGRFAPAARRPRGLLQRSGQLVRECHFLTLVVVFQYVAKCMGAIQQGQRHFAPRPRTMWWMRSDGLQPRRVRIRQLQDALVLKQIHARGPARLGRKVRQQPRFFDIDVHGQCIPPALQVQARACEVAAHDVQQVGMQLGVETAVLALEIRRLRRRGCGLALRDGAILHGSSARAPGRQDGR